MSFKYLISPLHTHIGLDEMTLDGHGTSNCKGVTLLSIVIYI